MKQLVQNLRNGKTEVVEVPIPTPKPGAALVRTAVSLVSAGTERMLVEFAKKSLVGKARSRPDLAKQLLDKVRREGLLTALGAAFNRLDQPMPLGYSSSGTIVELGDGMEGFKVGQRVACSGGGYAGHAEYVVVPKNLLTPLPQDVDNEAAAFTTLGAIAMHAFRLAELRLGERVAVIGLGLLGQLCVAISKAAGCQVLGIDLDPQRLAQGKLLGAQTALRENAEAAGQEFSRGRGCDAVLICADTSSNDPVELAGVLARDKAKVIAAGNVGLDLPRNLYFEKELSFMVSRSYGPGRYDTTYEEGGVDYPIGYVRWTEGRNLEAFVELLETGQLDISGLITHRFPIEDAEQAYQMITGKNKQPFTGVLLTYPEAAGDLKRQKAIQFKTRTNQLDGPGRIKLGVLGAGNFALTVLLPALRRLDNLDFVGIASASGLSARHAASRFGFKYADSDPSRIIEDAGVNTIAILTRHHLHAEQVIAALEAKKHVFCEKPLAITREELIKIEERLENSPGSLLMVGFNRRFAPFAEQMQTFLAESGEPLVAHYRVNAGHLPANHWLFDAQQGGGRIVGEGCHFIDFLSFLVGQPSISVTAKGIPDEGRYLEDNVVMTFTFPDGSVGTLTFVANGDKALPKEHIEVFSGGRVAILDDFRRLVTIKDGKRSQLRARMRQDKGHLQAWRAFTEAILQTGEPPIPYEHVFGVARAAFAALEALRTGEAVKI
ncbi:MAG: zinc-binding dehydrogenase [Chloroflexi bacterium]|nr:zinc-binding dehydrogenase [Chloroflexota bacterium]